MLCSLKVFFFTFKYTLDPVCGKATSWFWHLKKNATYWSVIKPSEKQPSTHFRIVFYILVLIIDELWNCEKARREKEGGSYANMNRAILVWDLDHNNCDSAAPCDRSFTSICDKDKHLHVKLLQKEVISGNTGFFEVFKSSLGYSMLILAECMHAFCKMIFFCSQKAFCNRKVYV